MPQIRIGISGWNYKPWRGRFYPRKLAQKRELEYAAEQLNAIEINGTFYSLQRPSSFRAWVEQTPDDFVFAVKGSRYITKELYASGYSDEELRGWARRIRSWSRGSEPRDAVKFTKMKPRKRSSRDVYVYFDNDAKVHAPFNAMRLAEMLGVRK